MHRIQPCTNRIRPCHGIEAANRALHQVEACHRRNRAGYGSIEHHKGKLPPLSPLPQTSCVFFHDDRENEQLPQLPVDTINMKPFDTIRTLANAYSFSLQGLTDEACYDVKVDHERCDALRKHFDRYAQDFETTRAAEKLLLSRAGWDEEAVSEILEGAGSRAVLRRIAWLSEFSQTQWWRPDFSESTRQEMCQELKSMRVVQQVENVTEVVPEHCIPNLVDPSDTVPQPIVNAYHRDLMDIILSSPNREQSEIAALSLGELTSTDKAALLPVLQWNDPFRRTIASGLLLREGITDGTLVAPLLRAYFRETNAEIRLALQLYLEIIERTGGMSLRHFSEEAQRATLQELSIAVAENDAATQLDFI